MALSKYRRFNAVRTTRPIAKKEEEEKKNEKKKRRSVVEYLLLVVVVTDVCMFVPDELVCSLQYRVKM